MQRLRRLLRLDDDLAAVAPVADLRPSSAARELRRRAERDDLPLAHDGDTVGELLSLVEVVRGQENRLPQLAQRADHVPRRPARRRIEPCRRLVEEEDLGVADEPEGEVEPPLLPAGERLHAVVALLGEADEVNDIVGVTRRRVVAGEERDVLAHREVDVHRRRLEDDADALAPALAAVLGVGAEDASPSPRRDGGTPRGSRRSSSCPRRSGPAVRRPRPRRCRS